jgi:hypothetical protein
MMHAPGKPLFHPARGEIPVRDFFIGKAPEQRLQIVDI